MNLQIFMRTMDIYFVNFVKKSVKYNIPRNFAENAKACRRIQLFLAAENRGPYLLAIDEEVTKMKACCVYQDDTDPTRIYIYDEA